MVCTSWIDSVFIGDDFPEFSTDLVTALTSLNVNKFSHLCSLLFKSLKVIKFEFQLFLRSQKIKSFLKKLNLME